VIAAGKVLQEFGNTGNAFFVLIFIFAENARQNISIHTQCKSLDGHLKVFTKF